MISSESFDRCVRRNEVKAYTLVIVVASLLIINLGVGSAWAEKGGAEKEAKNHEEKTPAKEQKGNHNNSSGKDTGNEGTNGGAEKPGKGSSPQPPRQKSPPPPQRQDPPANSHNTGEQAAQPVRLPQNTPQFPAQKDRAARDSIAIIDAFGVVSTNHPRHIPERIGIDDGHGDGGKQLALKKSSTPISIGSKLRITDQIGAIGAALIPPIPRITVTSPPMLQVSSDQKAEITFDSTAAGTYSIAIRNIADMHYYQTLRGQMNVGGNSAIWDGKKASGEPVPAGQYIYYILAGGEGGVRQPPQNGDGTIMVLNILQSETPLPMSDFGLSISLIALVACIAAAGLLIISKRRKSLTIYLPAEATSVVNDLKEAYPQALVGDYFEPTKEGVKRYAGVTIQDPKDGNDQWQSEITEKVKAIAGADSVRTLSKGRVQVS